MTHAVMGETPTKEAKDASSEDKAKEPKGQSHFDDDDTEWQIEMMAEDQLGWCEGPEESEAKANKIIAEAQAREDEEAFRGARYPICDAI